MLTDVLIDARRRQNMANLRPLDTSQASSSSNAVAMQNNNNNASVIFNAIPSSVLSGNDYHDPNLSDDEPIYDPVADDDYEPMPPIAQQVNLMRQKILKLNNSFG